MRHLGLLLRLVGAGERIGANLVSKGEELKNVPDLCADFRLKKLKIL
jgi:hypothetical protein